MKLLQLRNATMILSLGEQRLLVDPMLSAAGALPGFKLLGGGRRANPLVPLPDNTGEALETVTGVLLTHEHPDHFDPPALRWILERELPVWCSVIDLSNLRRKGVNARAVGDAGFDVPAEAFAVRHGRGVVGWMMGPVSAFYLAHPDEPSVLLTGDAVLTAELIEAFRRLDPEVVVAPAGAANFGIGPDILFSVDELVDLTRGCKAQMVFNHLEALDHCPTTRSELRRRMKAERLTDRVVVPADGEELTFTRTRSTPYARPRSGDRRRGGLQKWLTGRFSGT